MRSRRNQSYTRGCELGRGLGVGLGLGVELGVTVGLGVGVGPDCAQYLPPLLKLKLPPQMIISLPVQTAVCPVRAPGALSRLIAIQISVSGL